jgi:hypothetical protein
MIKIFAAASMVVAVLCFKAASGSVIHGGDILTSPRTGYTTGGAHSHEASDVERYLYAATGLIFLAAGGYLFKKDSRNNTSE